MSTPNYRDLCIELLGWVERQSRHHYTTLPLVLRARAELAVEPQEPEVDTKTSQPLTLGAPPQLPHG